MTPIVHVNRDRLWAALMELRQIGNAVLRRAAEPDRPA